MLELFKKAINTPLGALGLEVRRSRGEKKANSPSGNPLPPLISDPLTALCLEQGGEPAAFHCPLSQQVNSNALSYGPAGFHPFVETLREYAAGKSSSYEDSLLKTYYEQHQPRNAAESIVGFEAAPDAFRRLPPHLYLLPWRALSPKGVEREMRNWYKADIDEHAEVEMTIDTDGVKGHGPVSQQRGALEYHRLVTLYERIKREGYDRRHGHAHFLLLRKNGHYRFLQNGPGVHRTAVMAALGYESIPAVFARPWLVDWTFAPHWPRVTDGEWDTAQAKAYVEHLFAFDSRAWGRTRGFIFNQSGDPPTGLT